MSAVDAASAARLAAQAAHEGLFISGACGHEQRPFYRRLTGPARWVATNQAAVVIFDTEDVRLQDILGDLSIAFRWEPPQKAARRRVWLKGLGNAIGEGIKDVVDDVAGVFEDIAQGVKDFVSGKSAGLNQTLNLVSYNWDPETRSAKNKSMPFYHAPWAVCTDCYANIEVYVDVRLEFGPAGLPKVFHAEAGGRVDGKIFIEAKNPTVPAANGMANWHQLAPRFKATEFTFMLGSVPVLIVVYVELNGAADVDTDLTATFSVGAEAHGHARFGVDYGGIGNGWSKIMDTKFDFAYFKPVWSLKAQTAKATMHLSPEIVVALWDAIPVVVKPKPFVSASFGEAATEVKADLTCGDAYAVSSGMDVGLGTDPLRVPTDIPVIGGTEFLPEADFGTQTAVPEMGFPECGPLCGGCFSAYVKHKAAYEREAHEHSADKAEAADKLKEAAMSPGGVAAAVLLSLLVLGGACFVSTSMRREQPGRLQKVHGCGHALVALFAPAVAAELSGDDRAGESDDGTGTPLWETDPAFRARRKKAFACLFVAQCAAAAFCLAAFILMEAADGWQLTWRGVFLVTVGVLAWVWYSICLVCLVRAYRRVSAADRGIVARCLSAATRAARLLDVLFSVLATIAFAACVSIDVRLVQAVWTEATWCMFGAAVCATTLAFVRTGQQQASKPGSNNSNANGGDDEKERPDSVCVERGVEMQPNPIAAAAAPPARREHRVTITNPSDLAVVTDPTRARRTARQTLQPSDMFTKMWEAGEEEGP